MRWVRRFCTDSRGTTAVEYGLIIALIALTAIPGLLLVATQEDQTYQQAVYGLGEKARKGD